MDFSVEIFSAPITCETPGPINQTANVKHKKASAVAVNLSFPISGIPPQMPTADNIERDILNSLPPPWLRFKPTFPVVKAVSSFCVASCLFDGLNTR